MSWLASFSETGLSGLGKILLVLASCLSASLAERRVLQESWEGDEISFVYSLMMSERLRALRACFEMYRFLITSLYASCVSIEQETDFDCDSSMLLLI